MQRMSLSFVLKYFKIQVVYKEKKEQKYWDKNTTRLVVLQSTLQSGVETYGVLKAKNIILSSEFSNI